MRSNQNNPAGFALSRDTYRIVRIYQNGHHANATIKTGLTLDEAQRHCRDPQTSSSTCTTAAGQRLTRTKGPWFDGYTKE